MKSFVSYPERGNGGRNNYRGNCSPQLIEDIIVQFNIMSLSDYMVGSGTTEDVCLRKGILGSFYDLNRGYDMVNMDMPDRPENIFWHPPYGDIVVYSDQMYKADEIIHKYGFDPRVNDLSRCKDWNDFVKKMNYCMNKQFASLEKGGRMFVLMGDIKKKGKLYSMLCDIAKPGTLEQIVIKMQHNCTSDSKTYCGKFIPIVHEYLMIVKKDSSLIYDIQLSKTHKYDIRNSLEATWCDVIAAVLEDEGKEMSLSKIYNKVSGYRKCQNNEHWREKVRQTVRIYPDFLCVATGVYRLN